MSAAESCARPALSRSWFSLWSPHYLVFRCVLQLVSLRSRSEGFRELESRAPTRALVTAPTDTLTATDDERSRLPCHCKSAAAAVELAIASGHASEELEVRQTREDLQNVAACDAEKDRGCRLPGLLEECG